MNEYEIIEDLENPDKWCVCFGDRNAETHLVTEPLSLAAAQRICELFEKYLPDGPEAGL
jgi:hypothetical protein